MAIVEHGQPLQKIQRPMPEPTGTEVRIKVTHCGVCHTDLHVWDGYWDLGGGKLSRMADRLGIELPRAPGHEILGAVDKLGPDAGGVTVGERHIVYPWVGCGRCRRCEIGDDNLCATRRSLSLRQDGGFASYVMVPHPKYLIDAGNVDPAVACTFGCSGITALSAIRKVMPLPADEAIVVIGAGGLGLSALVMLRALGHQKIISIDINAEKQEAAMKLGATTTVDGTRASAAEDILAAAGGPVFGVLDFVNNSKTASLALEVLGKGGKMVQVGVMGGELKLSLVDLVLKAVTVMGISTGNPADLREVACLARDGKLLPIPTTTVPWDEANNALIRLRDGQVTGRLVLIHP